MLPTHALMESLSANLHDFLHRIDGDLTKPQKKFLRDGLVGLVRAGRPIICQMARKMPTRGGGATFLARRDRLETHLNDDSDLDQAVRESLPALWAPRVRLDTPIILDLTDIAKPLAEKMDYLATVRDGSTGELVNGYWMIELYASIRRKNPIPILMHPFSHEEPLCPGQNPLIIEAVRQVFRHTGGRGVLVIDRGGDARVLLEDWLNQGYLFVVRLRGDRDLLRFYGALGGAVDSVETCQDSQWVRVEARVLAEQIPTPHRWRFLAKSKGRTEVRTCQVGWVKVRLPGRPEDLTMVVSRMPGREAPLMLLTSLPVACFCDARRVLRHYRRRWECEEGIRFLKDQVKVEQVRAFHWTAICRLVLLCVLVMLYLTCLLDGHPKLAERLIILSEPLPDEPELLLYRLVRGLAEVLHACFYMRRALL